MSLHIDGACPRWQSLRAGYTRWIPGNIEWHVPALGWYGWEYQVIFNDQLFSRHPREPEVTRQWRFSQYKPFTKDFFLQGISMCIGSIFQDSGYSITLSDKDDNDYIWGNNFEGKNLPGYIANSFKSVASDANGYYLVIPKEPAAATTSRVRPDIWFIYSKHIIHHTKDEIVFKRDGLIWAVNRFGYWRWRWSEESKRHELVEPEGYYPHMLGYVPIVVAGGIKNDQGFYDSWFVSTKALADEFVAVKSGEQMVRKEASHPYIIEASEECPDCDGGKVQCCSVCNKIGDGCQCDTITPYLQTCGTCHGSGEISHNPGERMIAPADQMQHDLVQIINPDVGINKLHSEDVAELEVKILKSLHLFVIDQAQSGKAKALDMQTRNQFVLSISNDLFDRVIPRLIETITGLRNVTVESGEVRPAAVEYTIIKPTQFDIKTSFDLLEEMKMVKETGMPSYIVGALQLDHADKQFGGDDVLKRKVELINQMDKLANKPVAEVSMILLNGGATNREYQFSTALPVILDTLAREQGQQWFLSSTYDVIKAAVDTIFSTTNPPIPTIDPNIEVRENV